MRTIHYTQQFVLMEPLSLFFTPRFQSLNLVHVPDHSQPIYEFRWLGLWPDHGSSYKLAIEQSLRHSGARGQVLLVGCVSFTLAMTTTFSSTLPQSLRSPIHHNHFTYTVVFLVDWEIFIHTMRIPGYTAAKIMLWCTIILCFKFHVLTVENIIFCRLCKFVGPL